MIKHLGGVLRERFVLLFSPRRAQEQVEKNEKEVIEGSAGNVIIVKSPNTEYFKEAIFILCDDLFARSGVSRQQLLREARRAALNYTAAHVPPREHAAFRLLGFYLLGAASSLLVLLLFKLI